ncbi:MAG: dihydrodipicolinate synthase family protein [Anaerolineae bacterium]
MRSFDGFWPALLTPYTPDDQVNLSVVRDLVDYHLGKGVTGFYLCGSTGEGLFLSPAERRTIVETVMERVAGRASVIVHVGAAALNDAVALAQHAAASGADGVSSIVPPVAYDARGIAPYLARVAAAAPDLPFLPYLFGGTRDSLALMRDLADVPNFAGTKYYGPNMYEMSQIAAFRNEGWTVFVGMDEQAALGLMYGAHGIIGSSLNLMPGVYRCILERVRAGEMDAALDMQRRSNTIIQLMHSYGYVGCMRTALAHLGFDCGAPRLPNLPLPAAQCHRFLGELEDLGFAALAAL